MPITTNPAELTDSQAPQVSTRDSARTASGDKAAARERTIANVERKLAQVRLIGFFQAASSFATIFVSLALVLVLDNQTTNTWLPAALLVLLLFTGLIYLAAALIAWPTFTIPGLKRTSTSALKQREHLNLLKLYRRRYVVASSLVVGTALFAITLVTTLVGSATPVTAFFLIIPALAGIFEFSRWATFTSAFLSGLSLSILITVEQLFKVYHAPLPIADYPVVTLFLWLLALSVITISVVSFTSRFARANNHLQERTTELSLTVTNLENVLAFLSQLATQVNSATSELTATTSQQAGSAQEQAAAVGQVSTSLEELGETASQIAQSAQGAAVAAAQMVAIARQVEEQSYEAAERAGEGNVAVEAATTDLVRVRDRIDALSQRLVALTEQARRVVTTLGQIDEIADETHLLALNASIEAAGEIRAGEVAAPPLPQKGGGTDVHSQGRPDLATPLVNFSAGARRGPRFGIVAQEIKNLSDRSREFTTEIKEAVTEMQGTLGAAVLVAEEGRKALEAALIRSQIAGAVINRLAGVVAQGSKQYSQVITTSALVQQKAEEISLATGQQRSANLQIVQTIRNLAELAHQGAAAVEQVSQTVGTLSHQTGELSGLLAQAGLTATFVPFQPAPPQSPPPTTNLHQLLI